VADAARTGEWFQTHSGRKFWPLDARVEDVDLLDVAHALARLCRFNGHVRDFYSVAQHSVFVSRLVEERARKTVDILLGEARELRELATGGVRELAAAGLLHDAAEAYLGDMIRPLKVSMPAYREAEERLERVIAERFGLPFPWHPSVKLADDCLLMTERRDVLAVQRPWQFRAEPMIERIVTLGPEAAEALFLARAQELRLA